VLRTTSVDTQSADCAVCTKAVPLALYPVRDLVLGGEGVWPFVLCTECGHGYLDPRPTDEALGAFYESLYTPENTRLMAQVGKSGFERRLQRRRLRALQDAGLVDPQKILDVGAGLGVYLERLAAAFPGAGAVGVETSIQAASEAQKRKGITVLAESFERADLEEGAFDLVCMNHILEHLARPRSFLEKAERLLRAGGLLQVEVPRLDGWARRLLGRWYWPHLPPQHLQLFSREGLERLLQETGFTVESRYTAGYPASLSSALVLGVRFTVGSRSRYARNWLVRAPVVVVGLALLPVALALDGLVAPILNRLGAGDILTVVARKQ